MLKDIVAKIDKEKIKAYLVMRSTWEGIIMGISLIISWIKPQYKEVILSTGGAIWSIIRIVTKDSKSFLGQSFKAAVDARDELKAQQDAK